MPSNTLLAVALAVQAETITRRAVGIADGDTITVLDAQLAKHNIRLAGIDAPEKSQLFGKRSKESLPDRAYKLGSGGECTSARDSVALGIGNRK